MRKKVLGISLVVAISLLYGCAGSLQNETASSNSQIVESTINTQTTNNNEDTAKNNETTSASDSQGYSRMVKIEDKIYVDTGEISNMPRCGVMDFSFDSSVKDGVPTKNNQTNFGKGYEGQYGTRENRIEIRIDDQFHVFAHNENDFEGVEIKVTDNTNTSLVLEIYHETECQVEYGEDFLLEKWDEKYHAWMPVSFANDNFAFNDIAYLAEKGKVTEWTVNWDYAYRELEKGKYRIVKKFIDYKVNGNNEFHILSAEFECE